MRESKLRTTHRKVAAAVRSLEAAKGDLNRAILAAQESGMSIGDIAGELGVSRSRAWEMVRQADGRGRSVRS